MVVPPPPDAKTGSRKCGARWRNPSTRPRVGGSNAESASVEDRNTDWPGRCLSCGASNLYLLGKALRVVVVNRTQHDLPDGAASWSFAPEHDDKPAGET